MLIPDLFRPIVFLNAKEWAITIICFISPVILWLFIKPHLIFSQKVQTIQEQLNKFKNNEGLFQRLLKAQDPCLLLPEDDSLMLGNKDAKKIITIVTNPYCPPCAKAHKTLEEWLSVYNNFKLQVIFSTKSNGKDVAGHIISLARDTNNKSNVSKALAEWYNQDQKDYPLWSKLYPVENNYMSVEGILEKHEEWCESTRIAHTPTILINGNYLPIYYQLDDVKYFVM
jgi:protein-disulfide isomerase